jgi:F-type H+-transporting ATPase subunit epsilon
MKLKILMPTEILLDEAVTKVNATAENGSFCLLPRHVDFVSALTPGVLSYVNAEEERFVAHAEGILVKCGALVTLSTRSAIPGQDLETLRQVVDERFGVLDEHERVARSATFRLEADLVRRFIELERGIHA